MRQIASVEFLLLPLDSLVIKTSAFGEGDPGFNSHLWHGYYVYRILKSNSFANLISFLYMLVGSMQVLQGHCPLDKVPSNNILASLFRLLMLFGPTHIMSLLLYCSLLYCFVLFCRILAQIIVLLSNQGVSISVLR